MNKLLPIFYEALPVFVMVALIPIVHNDLLLVFIYAALIGLLLTIKRTKHDLTALSVGVIAMTISELIFIGTGVEEFERDTLFGLMPLWLPLLWGYGFVVIKRTVILLRAS